MKFLVTDIEFDFNTDMPDYYSVSFDDQKRENEAYVLEKKLGKKFMFENEPCKVF